MKGTYIQILPKRNEVKAYAEPQLFNNYFDSDLDFWNLGLSEDPNYFNVDSAVVVLTGNTNVTSAYQEIAQLLPDTYYDVTLKAFSFSGTLNIHFLSSLPENYGTESKIIGDQIHSFALSGSINFDQTYTIKTSDFPRETFTDALYIYPRPEDSDYSVEIVGIEIELNTSLNQLETIETYLYEESHYLDIVDDLPMPLNYSIDAIESPEKKDTNFSKTITLPSSDRNRIALGHLHDDTATFDVFNPNNKSKAIVWSDGTPVFTGFFQLLNVSRIDYGEGGKNIEYEGRLYSDTTSFFNKINKKPLNELDLAGYNHQLNINNVVASWDHTFEDLYTYPLVYSDATEYYSIANDFNPAFYARKLVDEIFLQNELSVSYSTGITQHFDKMIIPFVEKRPLVAEEYLDGIACKVSGNNYTFINYTQISETNDEIEISSLVKIQYIDSEQEDYTTGDAFNLALDTYVVFQNGDYNINVSFPFKVKYTNDPFLNLLFFNNSQVNETQSRCYLTRLRNGVTSILDYDFSLYNGTGDIVNLQTGTTTVVDDVVNLQYNGDFQIGDQIYVTFEWFDSSRFYRENGGNSYYLNANIKVEQTEGGYFEVNPNNFTLSENGIVEINKFLPNLKQGDLVKDFQKVFNWLYLVNPNSPNHVHLITRKEYYDNGDVLDWTEKLDNNQPATTEFLSDVVAENLLFSYKESDESDSINELYSTTYGEIYGQKEVIFDNDFVSGTQTIGLKNFKPTPITRNKFGQIVPAIDYSGSTKPNRLLYYGGKQENQVFDLPIRSYDTNTGLFVTENYDYYPLNIHLNNYTASTFDLNYGEVLQNFAGDDITLTSNNLYNLYWSDYVRQIKDGRRLNAKFFLDQKDIQELENDLSKKIFIYNKYWTISRIKDYFPNKKSSTEVELVSWFEASDPQFEVTYSEVPNGGIINPNGGTNPPVNPDFPFVPSVPNEIIDNGSGNNIPSRTPDGGTPSTLLVNGNNNRVNAKQGAILAADKSYVYEEGQVVVNKDFQFVGGELQQQYYFVGGQSYLDSSNNWNLIYNITNAPTPFIVGGKGDLAPIAYERSDTSNSDLYTGDYDYSKGYFIVGGRYDQQAMPYNLDFPPQG